MILVVSATDCTVVLLIMMRRVPEYQIDVSTLLDTKNYMQSSTVVLIVYYHTN